MRKSLENSIRGLSLATLIAGCTAPALEPAPTSTPTLVPTATPHVRVEPTAATPTPPPSVPGTTIQFAKTEETNTLIPKSPAEGPLSETQSLKNYLSDPHLKALPKTNMSFVEFMQTRGYKVYLIEKNPPKTGMVLEPTGLITRDLPTTHEGAKKFLEISLPKDTILKPIKYFIRIIKEDNTIEWVWAARFKAVGNPPAETWVFSIVSIREMNKERVHIRISPTD